MVRDLMAKKNLATVEAGLTASKNHSMAKGLMAYPDLATTKSLRDLLLAFLTLENTVDLPTVSLRDLLLAFLTLENTVDLPTVSLRENMLASPTLENTVDLPIVSLKEAMVMLVCRITVVAGDQTTKLVK